MTDNLRIGLPSKGRLSEVAIDILKEAGFKFRRPSRSLFARCADAPIDITFLRTDDIPVLCAEGAIDLGITGSDLVAESGHDLVTRLNLGVGQCRLAVCVPEQGQFSDVASLSGKRIATSFPHLTQTFLASHGVEAHTVCLSGSVEIMVSLGVADAVVDLVETGSTLAANQLRILCDIGRYETVVIQNSASRQRELADRVVRRLEGIVIARNYSLLEYNIPRSKLPEAEQITPGYNSPTVSALEDPLWCAVQVMVRRNEVPQIMDQIEAIGASAIFEARITNCRL
jgi:ATP phosphoribosyltransferase